MKHGLQFSPDKRTGELTQLLIMITYILVARRVKHARSDDHDVVSE